MRLYIARHAWAGNYGDPAWPDDSERPLTEDGVERYRRVVETLAERGFAPEWIATSPYVRCRQTAELIAEATGGRVEALDALAIGSDLETMIAWTNQTGAESVCWVGHNPDVEWLVAALLGDGMAGVRFAKGAVSALRFDGDAVRSASGLLEWHVTAKVLGC